MLPNNMSCKLGHGFKVAFAEGRQVQTVIIVSPETMAEIEEIARAEERVLVGACLGYQSMEVAKPRTAAV